MAKLVWFLVTLASFALVLSLLNFRDIPVDNDRFQVREEKRIAQEEERRKLEEEEAGKRAEAAAKAEVKEPALVLDTPELQNGHEVYFKKGKCLTCHGRKGEGKSSQQAPKLAAQHDWYIYSSLVSFKSGERVNQKMRPFLRNLSDQDFKDVATYLSQLPSQ